MCLSQNWFITVLNLAAMTCSSTCFSIVWNLLKLSTKCKSCATVYFNILVPFLILVHEFLLMSFVYSREGANCEGVFGGGLGFVPICTHCTSTTPYAWVRQQNTIFTQFIWFSIIFLKWTQTLYPFIFLYKYFTKKSLIFFEFFYQYFTKSLMLFLFFSNKYITNWSLLFLCIFL